MRVQITTTLTPQAAQELEDFLLHIKLAKSTLIQALIHWAVKNQDALVWNTQAQCLELDFTPRLKACLKEMGEQDEQ